MDGRDGLKLEKIGPHFQVLCLQKSPKIVMVNDLFDILLISVTDR